MKITIKKAKHFASGIHVRPYLGKKIISWNVKMDISCLYPPVNDDSNDLNKLCGISFGHHHKNSLRFAWRPDFNRPGQICIYAYWYSRGQRRSLYVGNIVYSIDYHFEITITGRAVTFFVDRIPGIHPQAVTIQFPVPKAKLGYYLWPYFGGNNTAPQNLNIAVRII
jgi:hypothetical protein